MDSRIKQFLPRIKEVITIVDEYLGGSSLHRIQIVEKAAYVDTSAAVTYPDFF